MNWHACVRAYLSPLLRAKEVMCGTDNLRGLCEIGALTLNGRVQDWSTVEDYEKRIVDK
jgi:hypothetical protein